MNPQQVLARIREILATDDPPSAKIGYIRYLLTVEYQG